ncbi:MULTISPECIES: hypothetical protein [Kitasatospora]|uniref:Uncharacterized protein n=1 Tax=Kitasatospora cathayae TaxID=3004092 RepID=A0ABY7Q159_9ACTN|nr:hypothetical protein [Kitasatospora sp. HUAS 3-15]WBP86375.1 hypothetical protein O1G21_11345 [Kitasatospora sp. HUAS 3-15]
MNDFPSHLSAGPFVWECPGAERQMAFVAGVLGIERDGEYVRPRLGDAVLEVAREAVDPAAGRAEPVPPALR